MIKTKKTTMAFSKLLLSSLALFAAPVNSEYEIPTHKANPPKMDPIPTLPKVTERVFFDIEIDGQNVGRIVFGLFGGIAPKAVENFAGLARCDKGKAKITGKDLCYRGSKIHRVVPNFMFQGGDFTHGVGTGGESIFGENFEDESHEVKFNRRYMLANAGKKNSNGSQFFVTTVKTQWLDGKHQIFGMVLSGMDTMIEIEKAGSHGGIPLKEIVVKNSGTQKLESRDVMPYEVSWRMEGQ